MPKVVFFTNVVPSVAEQLTQPASADFEVVVAADTLPVAEKVALAQDADFLLLFPSVIEDEVLQAATNLRLIQLVSAGFDKMNLPLCRELGVPIANNGGTNSIDVAEHTFTLILSFYRRLLEMDKNVRQDRWKGLDSGVTTYTIYGKTVGIIGLGHIGQQVAQRLIPFGARIVFFDPYPPAQDIIDTLGATALSLDDLLQQADIVTLHVPLMESTHHLLGQREFGLMKSSAIVVNTCRGPVINEADLTKALIDGDIAGAALDVLYQEPPDPFNAILKLPPEKVLFTPHTAGVTFDTWSRRGAFIFKNFAQVWAGGAPQAVISG